MNAALIAACIAAIVGGTFLVVKVIGRWVYRDPTHPDSMSHSRDWKTWEKEMRAKVKS
jgi:hypothetical protein